MYYPLLIAHSFVRWLFLISICFAIYRAYRGYSLEKSFTSLDNRIRHWTATIAHLQLIIGILLYTKSGVVFSYFKGSNAKQAIFFSIIHATIMLTAIVMITVGSSKAKRKTESKEKFLTMLFWFSIALALILIAIPWPFSPLTQRPAIRLH